MPEHLDALNLHIPSQDSPPVVLRTTLHSLQDVYERAKRILEQLFDLNRLLGERHEMEAKIVRRELLLQEVKALKADAMLEYLMQHPEVCSIPDVPDRLLPNVLRGTTPKSNSIPTEGWVDDWRYR